MYRPNLKTGPISIRSVFKNRFYGVFFIALLGQAQLAFTTDPQILSIDDIEAQGFLESQAISPTSSNTGGEQIMPGFYSEFNAGGQREELAETAGEFIDPFSGSLNLRHTDVTIPGQGGFDLNIVRTYSSSNVYRGGGAISPNPKPADIMEQTQLGIGWEMHFGRIRRQTDHACVNPNGTDASSSPVLETADGSQKQLVYNDSLPNRSNAVYVTKDYWYATCFTGGTGLVVVDPNGTIYWMTHRVFSSSRYFGLSGYVWYVTKIRDRNHNELYFTYENSSSGNVSRITSNDGRLVTFSYSQGKLRSIGYNGKGVTYFYNGANALSEVRYPEGRKRYYDYFNEGDNHLLLRKAIRKAGGYTTYDYRYTCKANTGCGRIYSGTFFTTVTYNHAIKRKVDYDINGNSTPWDFFYSFNNGFDYTTVAFPGGKYEYKHYSGTASEDGGLPNYARAGLLQRKSIFNGNSVIQRDTYAYQIVKMSNQNQSRFPLSFFGINYSSSYTSRLVTKTTSRGGVNYVTRFQNFSDGRNPHTIIETGDESRTKTLSYRDITPLTGTVSKYAYMLEDESYGTGANRKIDRGIDNRGNLTYINEYGVVTRYSYYSNGNVATKKDALNNIINYSNYYRGIPRREALPKGIIVTRTVSSDGWVTSERDGRGYLTSYNYDHLGRLNKIDTPRGRNITMSWSKSGFKDVQTIRRGGYEQKVTYDGFGRIICDEKEGIYSGTVYDGLGRVITRTYPNNSSCTSSQDTNFTYDSLGRLLKTTHVDGTFSQYTYRSENRVQLRDEAAKIFNFQYRSYADPENKLLMSTTGPENLSVLISRNVLGQETEIERSGKKRAFNYGSNRSIMSEIHPETGTTAYTRDANGNIKTKKVGTSELTRYHYDELNRLERIDYPSGTTPDVLYSYDKNSNLDRLQAGISDFDYVYDENNNLTRENHKIDGTNYSTSYTYSDLDHLSTLTYHDNVLVTYTPNDLGWPTKALPYVTGVAYHPNGAPSQITYENGRSSSFTINDRQWALRATTNGGISDQGVLSYDGVGNIKRIKDYLSTANDRALAYDDLHRLKTASGPWGSGSISYSNTGDITSKRMGGNNLVYSYSGNKISSVSGLPSFNGNTAIRYDVYGNMTKKVSATYGWTYEYDDASNLRKVYNRSNALIRRFEYAGNNMKVKSVTPTEQRRYIYSNTGNLLSNVRVSGARPSIHNVYLGSTLVAEIERNVTDPESQVEIDSNDAIYGYGFGDDDHKYHVKGYFDLTKARSDIKMCVNGHGINSDTEVSVIINGHSLGFLERGGSPKKSCFVVPRESLIAGRNVVSFTQSNPGDTWGVQFQSVNSVNSSMAPIIMLLLSEEEV